MTDTVFTFDVSYQAQLLVYALAIGALIGALYDLFRVFRVFLQPAAKNGDPAGGALMTAVCFVGDVAFFILSAVIVTTFLFHANH